MDNKPEITVTHFIGQSVRVESFKNLEHGHTYRFNKWEGGGLVWTREKPTIPGKYWRRIVAKHSGNAYENQIVDIIPPASEPLSEDYCFEWAGPIPEPQIEARGPTAPAPTGPSCADLFSALQIAQSALSAVEGVLSMAGPPFPGEWSMSEAYQIWLNANGDREDPAEEMELKARLDAYSAFVPNEHAGNEEFEAFNAGWFARVKWQAALDEMNRPGEAPTKSEQNLIPGNPDVAEGP